MLPRQGKAANPKFGYSLHLVKKSPVGALVVGIEAQNFEASLTSKLRSYIEVGGKNFEGFEDCLFIYDQSFLNF